MSDEPEGASRPPFDSAAARGFRCPSCGGPVGHAVRLCEHCGSPLATRRCLGCFSLSPADAKRCGKCGVLLPRLETAAPEPGRCPDCEASLVARSAGSIGFSECPRCAGLFLRRRTFDEVARSADARAMARLAEPEPDGAEAESAAGGFRYRPCPVCRKLMNRTAFAPGSRVVVDTCKKDGVWCDAGELTAIIDFIEGGGYESARRREKERLAEEVSRLRLERSAAEAGRIEPPAETRGSGLLGVLAEIFLGLR